MINLAILAEFLPTPRVRASLPLCFGDFSDICQLADIVAGAVWRRYERDDDRFLKLAEKSFRRSRSGQIMGYGIVKVPKSGWV